MRMTPDRIYRFGREYTFSSFRVSGWWHGEGSGVQILPPPDDAPQARLEIADHPFILEFPIEATDNWGDANFRRKQAHRDLTLLLNVLLSGHTSRQFQRQRHFWADVSLGDARPSSRWVQEFYSGKLGNPANEGLSPISGERLEDVDPDEYYTKSGHDGRGLRVPRDLDALILTYRNLSSGNREKFDRALYWMDQASRQWHNSISTPLVALVSAIESLTPPGEKHGFECPVCHNDAQHEVMGLKKRFRQFLDTHDPIPPAIPDDPEQRVEGERLRQEIVGLRDEVYDLRSGIVHGSRLMLLDQEFEFESEDFAEEKELEVIVELWVSAQRALRNWLKNPPTR